MITYSRDLIPLCVVEHLLEKINPSGSVHQLNQVVTSNSCCEETSNSSRCFVPNARDFHAFDSNFTGQSFVHCKFAVWQSVHEHREKNSVAYTIGTL